MNIISKLALVCAITLPSAHVTYGMENDNNKKRKEIDENQIEESNKKAKKVSNEEIFDAAENGDLAFFQKHNDIDLTIKNFFGETPLHRACQVGNIDIVEFIVNKDPERLKEKDNFGKTPLHWACMKGHIAIVELIVNKDPEHLKDKDEDGRTPLRWACFNRHTDVVKLIVNKDSERLKDKDEDGWTPLHCACFNGNIAIVKLIVNKDPERLKDKDRSGRTPLHDACIYGHSDIVELIVNKDSERLKDKSNNGWTPLHRACMKGQTETIKLLLLLGADFNVVENKGQKPLMRCSEKTRTTMCNYIKELRSKPIFLLAELCKHNKKFTQKALTFLMSLKFLFKTTNVHAFKVAKPLIFMIVKMANPGSIGELLVAENEVDQLIQKWTTKDKNNNNN